MPDHRASSGGVRSLRAMFEQSADDVKSPEVRGRSPAPSLPSIQGDGTASPRPLSKVRTSFVGVESSGQLALTTTRGESSHRASSRAVSENSEATGDKSMSHSPAAIRRPIPEDDEAIAPPVETVISKIRNLSGARKDENSNPDKPTPATENTEAQLKSAGSKEEAAVSGGKPLPSSAEPTTPVSKKFAPTKFESEQKSKTPGKENGTPSRSIALAAKLSTPKAAPTPPRDTSSKSIPAKPAEASIATSQETSSEDPITITPSTPTSSKPGLLAAKTSTSTSSKAATAKPQLTSSRTPNGSAGPSAASARSSRPSARMSTASVSSVTSTATNGTRTAGGFVKPRPRSPTRPVKLPAHLTAETASSAAKHQPEQPAQRKTLDRKASSRSLAGSVGAGGVVPRYMQDTRKRTQPEKEEKRGESRQGKAASVVAPDESFLARMMRPTASSSSKVHTSQEQHKPKTKVAPRKANAKSSHASVPAGGSETVTESVEPIDETEYEHVDAELEAPNGEPIVAPTETTTDHDAVTHEEPAGSTEEETSKDLSADVEPEAEAPTLAPEAEKVNGVTTTEAQEADVAIAPEAEEPEATMATNVEEAAPAAEHSVSEETAE